MQIEAKRKIKYTSWKIKLEEPQEGTIIEKKKSKFTNRNYALKALKYIFSDMCLPSWNGGKA